MGKMRFRKSFGNKAFRINLSNSGIGYSVGGKGARYTKMANGRTRNTFSVPGTGLSYVSESGKGKKASYSGNGSATSASYSQYNVWTLRIAKVTALMISIAALFLAIVCFATIILIPLGIGIGAIALGGFISAHNFKQEIKRRKKNEKDNR